MVGEIIDGKAIAKGIRQELAGKVAAFKKKRGTVPALHVVIVGHDPASKLYVRLKQTGAEEVGIKSVKHEFDTITEKKLLELIDKLNKDKAVHGILVQLPLPKDIDEKKVIMKISPEKDVDGFHVINMGKLFTGDENLLPCTPLGVIRMLEKEKVEIRGKDAVIVGRSNIVGKPLALMLLKRHATVTLCHTKTKDLASHTRRADLLIAAAWAPKMIEAHMVKNGAVVIDIGITDVNGKAVGDVDFKKVKERASKITPVPGGVGPMTVAMVLSNTLEAAEKQLGGYA
ncbi:MAG: bifunctional methylenetetrahydrofolate dehydrogenase/methenyltetrahydrofolate cyclohydrolase FolD [Candidatus Aenigmatarchaeota archaeon]|nr:MAG: bifunctional methylenetetrahydrofolate dehydrogenase/methenyltetrahydrofolate cyclohydrolase FolD [Candidatus Aenigmarchaeota archaeon]